VDSRPLVAGEDSSEDSSEEAAEEASA